MERFDIQARDGTKLVGVLEKSIKNNAPLVILCHELSKTKDGINNAFVRVAEKLNDAGIDTVRFDFRGHGESSGKEQDVTVFGEVVDLESVFDYCKSLGYTSIGILGASFGGAAACSFLEVNNPEVKSLVLWYPLLDGTTLVEGKSSWSKRQITKSNVENLKTKGYLVLGKQEFKLGRAAVEELMAFSAYHALSKSDIPVLIIHGDQDSYVPYSDSVKATVAGKQCTLDILDGAEHGFPDKHHEADAHRKTVEWFKKHLTLLK